MLALSGIARAEPVGTVRQPLVGGAVLDAGQRQDFGLLDFTAGNGTCSASVLRNDWAISAAHCVEVNGTTKPIPDPARPGQNMLKPVGTLSLTANWKAVQDRDVVRVVTLRPYDIALIKVASPFVIGGTTTGFNRLIFQDGQFPYFGEPVGASIILMGQGINVFAKGSGDSATPSMNDGQYRAAYAKPTRDADSLYWYPSSGNQSVAGGDSGGPSFAWVLSGYALVGVHSSTHATYVDGKPKTGWTWVTGTTEAADAPIAPVIPQLLAVMGPPQPSQTEPALEPPPPGFIGTFSRTPPNYQPIWLYGIQPNGVLQWYRKDTNASAWQGPRQVGTGWSMFKDVIAAGGNRFYALTKDGKLVWYQHDGFNNGSFSWKPASEVGSGWAFSRIFSGGDGVVYAIRKDGKLFWYRHNGFRDGARSWSAAKEVGSGWSEMKDVFSTGKGAVYGVKPDGTLLLYQQKDFENGARDWYPARTVGSGWNHFQQIIPAGDGVILAIQPDGRLLWYKHLGLIVPKLGRVHEGWEGPVQIGSGWQDFGKVVALIPESTLPIVR